MNIKAIIFGSTGMIGRAVLLECLENPQVESVLLVNRTSLNSSHPKVKEIIHADLSDCSALIDEFSRYNTCFFSVGVTAVGLTEAEYHKVVYGITIAVADALLKANKSFTFCYISGAGTDSTEKGNTMWARVKGKTENKLLAMPFKAAYMFRPGYIQPLKGIKSKTGWYNLVYTFFKPLYFLLKPLKGIITDTSRLSKAMVNVALRGYKKPILEVSDINRTAETLE